MPETTAPAATAVSHRAVTTIVALAVLIALTCLITAALVPDIHTSIHVANVGLFAAALLGMLACHLCLARKLAAERRARKKADACTRRDLDAALAQIAKLQQRTHGQEVAERIAEQLAAADIPRIDHIHRRH